NNDTKGNFSKSTGLPLLYGNNSVAIAADFDKDGDMDLFVGGRVIAKRYGDTPTSYLLINDGKGNFSVAPENTATGLRNIGMVTDAVWTDKNMDGWPDLVIVGEWMPVTVFINSHGRFENKTEAEGLANTNGLWQSVKAEDIDHNGYPDLMVGNWGENSKLRASLDYPLNLYVGDMDGNGSVDHVLAIAKEGKYYTFSNKEDLEKQFPAVIRKQFEGYAPMAGLTVDEIFGDRLKTMKRLSINTLSTTAFMNSGKHYIAERMPDRVQWNPVFAWAMADFNGDGKNDVLAAGNFYGVIPYEGRYDAGYGQVLLNQGNQWNALAPWQSGLKLDGEVRSIHSLRTINKKMMYLVARNNDRLMLIQPTHQ
ncbi:MAG: VCBS repeat-containing protein, partial [Ferruginibacter sp.]